MKRIVCLLCCLCIALYTILGVPAHADVIPSSSPELVEQGLDVTLLPSPLPWEFGPVQFAYRVSNHGMLSKRVDLVYQETHYRQGKMQLNRGALLAPGSSTILRFIRVEQSGYRRYRSPELQAYVNGKLLENAHVQTPNFYAYSSNHDQLHVLVGGSLSADMIAYAVYPKLRAVVASPIPLAQWPDDPKDYFSQRGYEIWLSPKDILPDGVKRALLEWVRAGGQLVYVYLNDDSWPKDIPGRKKGEHIQTLGLGRVVHFRLFAEGDAEGLRLFQADVEKLKEQPNSYSGKNKKEQPNGRMPHDTEFLLAMTEFTHHDDSSEDSLWMQFFGLPDPEVPLTLLLVMMILFSVLVFPLSHWYFRRKGNLLLLLLSTPACSLVFCLLVLLVITFADGWRIRTRTLGFTYLDQEERLAVTQSSLSILAPFVPSSDLKYGMEDRVCLYEASSNSHEDLVVADQPGQCIHPRIVTPRRPLNLFAQRLEHRGERLRVIKGNDGLEVVNGLGAEVEALCLVCEDGQRLVAPAPIPAGGRASLVPAPEWKPKTLPNGGVETGIFAPNKNDNYMNQMLFLYKNCCPEDDPDSTLKVDQFFANLPYSCHGFRNMFCAILRKPVFYSPGFIGDVTDDTQLVFGPGKAE